MNKYNFILKLKHYLLTTRDTRQQGFSLTECLVAVTMLGIAFGINLQFLAFLKIQNINQEILTGAVTISRNTLDDMRVKMASDLDTLSITGNTPRKLRNVTQSARIDLPKIGLQDYITQKKPEDNYIYEVSYYICTDDPEIDEETNTVSSCASGANDNARYIVVQVLDPNRKLQNNEKPILYTAQTIYTTLQQKQ
jgi:prepilin-type N-terminal cleavage/methylation domain-containing protein